MGHISGLTITETINVDVILGLPALMFYAQGCYSGYPTGKQIKSSHKSMTHHTTSCTPTAAHLKMSKDIAGEKVDSSLYQRIIGSLLYLTANRLEIPFVVGDCACYQEDPRTSHLHSASTYWNMS